ncbi:MAG TPA: four helix bundle protein [Terriglobia bacterium]|nr:four helix bundle protein [Terriglobia bacterium]
MTYERFEQLPVWQAAVKLGQQVYALTKYPPFRRQHSLRDQIERAAVSVSNNIAEGFERGTTQELLTFLYIARGSAGEVRSMLCLLEGISEFSNLKSEISNLKLEAERVSRQLRVWADSLQNTNIKGQRYLDDKVRNREKALRDRQEFLRELEQIRRGAAARGIPKWLQSHIIQTIHRKGAAEHRPSGPSVRACPVRRNLSQAFRPASARAGDLIGLI